MTDFLTRLAATDARLSRQWSIAQEYGWRRSLAILITYTGDVLPAFMILGVLVGSRVAGWRARAAFLLLADLAAVLVVQIVKYAVRRPRPGGVWGRFYRRTDPNSFPSGHAARGGAMTGMSFALSAVLGPLWLGAAAVAWGVLVSYSRVAMGVHYFSDVVAGFLIGLIAAGIMALVVF